MDRHRVIGFMNPAMLSLMYVTVIYETGGDVFVRYPSGTTQKVPDFEKTKGEILSNPNFIPVTGEITLSDQEIAFAISEKEIFIGTVEEVLRKIQSLLGSGRFKDDAEAAETLEKLLAAG